MFDLHGNVIGINTAIFSPTGGNVGIGFAIPGRAGAAGDRGAARRRQGQARLSRRRHPADDATTSPPASACPRIAARSSRASSRARPAARAGIRQGDVIVQVNNKPVTPDNTLSYIVANTPVGSRVPIELIRDGKRQTRDRRRRRAAARGPARRGRRWRRRRRRRAGGGNGARARSRRATRSASALQALTPGDRAPARRAGDGARAGRLVGRSVERRGSGGHPARRRDPLDQPAPDADARPTRPRAINAAKRGRARHACCCSSSAAPARRATSA